MDDLSFLSRVTNDESTGSLIVLLPDNSVSQIHNVSTFVILDRCPLLYHSFEFANSNRQANIEATSLSAIISLLRYLYTIDYLPPDHQGTFLDHAEAFKVGEDYDVPELQVSAYVNFSHATELACCFANPPTDLCESVRFLYHHLASHQSRQEQSLIDTLLHYCLSMFAYQGLGSHEGFRQVIWDLPAFHKDLCRLSMQRNFEDEGALDLVRLPVPYDTPHSMPALRKHALSEFHYELMQDLESSTAQSASDEEAIPTKRRKGEDGGFVSHTILIPSSGDLEKSLLVHNVVEIDLGNEHESESSSDDESGFTLVHRPKFTSDANTITPAEVLILESVPSSPELISAPSPQISTSLENTSEDDWVHI